MIYVYNMCAENKTLQIDKTVVVIVFVVASAPAVIKLSFI